ncbi:MAG: hypothetical protein ACTSUV_02445 [Candidatus Ranarchaeia archaeon]
MNSFEKQLKENKKQRDLLKKKLVVTVYGSFYPVKEKKKLLELTKYLRRKGFGNTDYVEGEKRPNVDDLDKDLISKKYLLDSDVNFLVFSQKGRGKGVTAELGYILNVPLLDGSRKSCVIFDQVKRGNSSITRLQRDEIKRINEKKIIITIVPYSNLNDLKDAAYSQALHFVNKYKKKLEKRILIE